MFCALTSSVYRPCSWLETAARLWIHFSTRSVPQRCEGGSEPAVPAPQTDKGTQAAVGQHPRCPHDAAGPSPPSLREPPLPPPPAQAAPRRGLTLPAGSAAGRHPASSRLCAMAAPPRLKEDYISQQAARPTDPPFPGAAPRPWLGRGGGEPKRAWLGGAAAAARSAASGASWGRRWRAARPGRSPGGRHHAEYVESAGAGGQGVSTAGRGQAGAGDRERFGRGPSAGPVLPPPPFKTWPLPLPLLRWLPHTHSVPS